MVETTTLWLGLFSVTYLALAFFWARQAAIANADTITFFSAGHSLAPWMSGLVTAGVCVSVWFLLGTADAISSRGFSAIDGLQAGVLLAIPGVLFFKRAWFLAERYRVSSQFELFRLYYKSEFLVVGTAAIALLFAVAFTGMQLRVISEVASFMTGGLVSPLLCGALLTIIVFSYVVIGGMRAVGYLGMLQTAALVSATLTLCGLILVAADGPTELMAALKLASAEREVDLFSVAGVVQFVAGFGRGDFYGHPGTAALVFGSSIAVLGVSCSPIVFKLILSTRSAMGIAAGQTWVLAGFFGALIMIAGGLFGSASIVHGGSLLSWLKALMSEVSPWFGAWVLFGLIAGMQVFSALALLVAAEGLVRHIYKPFFNSRLSRSSTVNITRIVIVVLAVISLLMAFLTPVALSVLGAFALPASAQLLGPLIGLFWFRWITPAAALTGFGFGLIAVFLTDAAGIYVLSYLGLELPWGRYPWTLHSAAWGLFCNALAIGIVSAVSRHRSIGKKAEEVQTFIVENLRIDTPRWLNSFAWSLLLVWTFLAIGPGVIFGNFAFVGANGHWLLTVPSIWGWSVLFWLLGLVLVWFLAYRMGMASPENRAIEPMLPQREIRTDPTAREHERLRRLVVGLGIGLAVFLFLVWSFGG